MFKKIKIRSFCIWVILRNLSAIKNANFSSKNVLRTKCYHLKLLEAFINIIFQYQKFLVSNKNSLEIGNFSDFCGQFWPFFKRRLQIFPEGPTGLWVRTFLNVFQHSDSKTFQKVHISCIETRTCWTFYRFFDSFGVILECFWSKTLQRTLRIMYCKAFVFSFWLCWNI